MEGIAVRTTAPVGPRGHGSGPSRIREADDLAGLAAIRRGGTSLAFWRRALPDSIAAGLAEIVAGGFQPVRFTAPPSRVAGEVADRLPPHPDRAWLAADAAALADTLARIAGVPHVALRLEVIEGDACRLFHVDRTALRLVTTYHGRGTQWLPDANGAASPADRMPEDRIHEIPSGAVAVFRGAAAGRMEALALLHRSPPRRPGDPARLFLAVEPAPSR